MENVAKVKIKELMRECFEMARDGAYTSRGFLYEDFDEYFEDIKDEFNSVVSKCESTPDETEHSKLTLADVSVPKGSVCEYCKEPNAPSGQCTNLMCTNYLNNEQTAR